MKNETGNKSKTITKNEDDFPPLIGNSFDKQREAIEAILQPTIEKAYPGTYKEIIKIIVDHYRDQPIQWIENSNTVEEISKAIAEQLGDKCQELGAIAEEMNDNHHPGREKTLLHTSNYCAT